MPLKHLKVFDEHEHSQIFIIMCYPFKDKEGMTSKYGRCTTKDTFSFADSESTRLVKFVRVKEDKMFQVDDRDVSS